MRRSRSLLKPFSASATAGLLAAGLLTTTGLGAATPASAAAPSGPDDCRPGYVWRGTDQEDHVCVLPPEQWATRAQNSLHRDRSDAFGQCLAGFVKRRAVPRDHVCVTEAERAAARRQNERAPINWQATYSRVHPDSYVPFPFAHAHNDYKVRSAYTMKREGKEVLYADVVQASTADGTGLVTWPSTGASNQRFEFRRAGNDVAYQNVFEIVAVHSGKCLDVAGWGKHDGARIIQWPCHGGNNQKWYLERRADNHWQIRSLHSGKCLDAHNPPMTAPPQGTYLQQWTCLGGRNQAWRVVN
ncbi:RICIN domain-containing protein [Streptomyces coeruleoprunus]|uniref:RICIN domain-containing protein n=1 Tax=Streptomyces coeruleoprunus TaxID=285563 RepID=A0ABV9XDJ3_9ACTN